MKKVTKAIFPVAGLGTRFLPATKAIPKEMLPIVDKPLIQYAVEEAISAGISELIFITGRTKRAITDHFDKVNELETELEKKGKLEKLNIIRNIIPQGITCIYIRQSEPLGLGHAILCAKSVIGDEPFAIILPDDLINDGGRGVTKQLVDLYEEKQKSIIAIENIPRSDTKKYGIVEISDKKEKPLQRISGIVEKPKPDESLSTLAVVGRYIFNSEIFSFLEKIKIGADSEIQLTDAIGMLLKSEPVYAYEFLGQRYDCGSKLGYMQASIKYALEDSDISDDLSKYLKKIDK
jgi:UTP--glucose-1-phosphate uridylyltransferase